GVLVGLLLGRGLAYLFEALNTSIRRPEDLEAVLHVPGLAVIPRISGGSANRRGRLRALLGSGKPTRTEAGSLMAGAQTFSIGIEAFRNLRTSLIWSDGGEALKTLVVTSAAPGEGKTLTAANLSATLAYDVLRVLRKELNKRFDISVLDTPPVLATADAGIVASLTDWVLLVVRAGTTDRNAAQRAFQQLANVGARVIGTVLNDPGGQVAKEGDY